MFIRLPNLQLLVYQFVIYGLLSSPYRILAMCLDSIPHTWGSYGSFRGPVTASSFPSSPASIPSTVEQYQTHESFVTKTRRHVPYCSMIILRDIRTTIILAWHGGLFPCQALQIFHRISTIPRASLSIFRV
ncbi:hypothetical protein F5Y02DRAFT_353099 [Annulohypoxylon stygium]|nr:hypothetical protein F5Y02DRAFT_353099 [Annulohypoxylon stygium]